MSFAVRVEKRKDGGSFVSIPSPVLIREVKECVKGGGDERTAFKTLDEILALLLAASAHRLLLSGVGTLVVRLRRLLSLFGGCRAAATEEHVRQTVADGRSNSDTSSGGSHLTEQTGTSRLLLCRHGWLLCVRLRRLLVVLLLLLVRRGHCVCTTRTRGCGSRRTRRST